MQENGHGMHITCIASIFFHNRIDQWLSKISLAQAWPQKTTCFGFSNVPVQVSEFIENPTQFVKANLYSGVVRRAIEELLSSLFISRDAFAIPIPG